MKYLVEIIATSRVTVILFHRPLSQLNAKAPYGGPTLPQPIKTKERQETPRARTRETQ
jgi:hypothetical protein